MKYYLLKMNSLSYSVSSLISGRPIVFSAVSQQNNVDFRLLNVGDFIATYYDDPINKINAIWQVEGDVSENSFTFNKICEVSEGSDVDQAYRERLEAETVIELHEKDYVKIKDLLCRHTKDLLFVKTEIDDKISRQRIIFGAPGTGKSFKLNEMANEYFPIDRNYNIIVKKAILDSKNVDDDKIIKALKIGYRYAAEINTIFGDQTRTQDEIKASFQLTEDDFSGRQWQELIYVAKAIGGEINKQSHVERVTFHPNYSYAQFVGTYKPCQDKDNEKQIVYKYVPGPFMRVYRNAKKDPNGRFLLLIEEINRANVAAVFGDVFQLLDRKNGVSEYSIAASEDIKKYLKDNGIDDCEELRIPDNMYIWATMNSADQGVLPMDTAFKRRWEFEYIDINHNQSAINSFYFPTSVKKDGDRIESYVFENWNSLRTKLNERLQVIGVNEDKLLGPFFINKDSLEDISSLVTPQKDEENKKYIPVVFSITADEAGNQNQKKIEAFQKSFESKVLMYLYEDMRMYRRDIFQIKDDDGKDVDKPRLSQIFKAFERDGVKIFNFSTDGHSL